MATDGQALVARPFLLFFPAQLLAAYFTQKALALAAHGKIASAEGTFTQVPALRFPYGLFVLIARSRLLEAFKGFWTYLNVQFCCLLP